MLTSGLSCDGGATDEHEHMMPHRQTHNTLMARLAISKTTVNLHKLRLWHVGEFVWPNTGLSHLHCGSLYNVVRDIVREYTVALWRSNSVSTSVSYCRLTLIK